MVPNGRTLVYTSSLFSFVLGFIAVKTRMKIVDKATQSKSVFLLIVPVNNVQSDVNDYAVTPGSSACSHL